MLMYLCLFIYVIPSYFCTPPLFLSLIAMCANQNFMCFVRIPDFRSCYVGGHLGLTPFSNFPTRVGTVDLLRSGTVPIEEMLERKPVYLAQESSLNFVDGGPLA